MFGPTPYLSPRSISVYLISLKAYDQVKGNQNLIRVWGGGFFEPDIFYDLCDEMGVLVWQDCKLNFSNNHLAQMSYRKLTPVMFACGVYPIFPEFLESVKKEAECNVKRLRHHPSLALFCGNNEDCEPPLPIIVPLFPFPRLLSTSFPTSSTFGRSHD